jgi:hypothetical protein
MADMIENLRIVLSLFYTVWLFSWGKKTLGSAKLAILFAVIVVYLTFIQFPDLVWVPVIIFLVAIVGPTFFEKVKMFE